MIATPNAQLASRWSKQLEQAEFPAAPEWVSTLRGRAAGAFAAGGLPHRKVEAWKYTPLKRLEALDLQAEVQQAQTDSPAPILEDVPAVRLVDGVPVGGAEGLPPGVALLSFEQAVERFEGQLQAMAAQIEVDGATHAFNALNTAWMHNSRVLHVARGVDAGTVLLQWVFSAAAAGRLSFSRLFLLLEDGASLQLVEQFQSIQPGALNVMVQAQLASEARLSHVRLQAYEDDSVLMTSSHVSQARGSDFSYCGFDLGGSLVRHELHTELAGEAAHCNLAGACVLDDQRHGDTRISVDHAAPGCSSEQFFRGVLGGSSRGVFNGRALIREGADGSSVQQSNANLLLSRLAEMDTKPELEIYADEVEASHGATVGQLDESAVFYLRTRGLSDAEARRILTAAFCHAVTDRLENQQLAEKIGAMIDASMPEAS